MMDKTPPGHHPKYGPRGRYMRNKFREKVSSEWQRTRTRPLRCARRKRRCLARICKRSWARRFFEWPSSGFGDENGDDGDDNYNDRNNGGMGADRCSSPSRCLPVPCRQYSRNQMMSVCFRRRLQGWGVPGTTTRGKASHLGAAATMTLIMSMTTMVTRATTTTALHLTSKDQPKTTNQPSRPTTNYQSSFFARPSATSSPSSTALSQSSTMAV